MTITLTGVAIERGSRILAADVSFSAAADEVVGLIGPNGCGKSTLLDVIAGRLAPAAGQVSLSAADSVGLLTQGRSASAGATVLECLREATGVARASQRLAAATALLESGDLSPAASQAYDAALVEWLARGGADLDDRMAKTFAEVGLHAEPDQLAATMSGGQAARLSLAGVLLSRYDALLLDEPTNDLDRAGLELLQGFVADADVPIILVSHDRAFLAATITAVVEFDPVLGRTLLYRGGFDAWQAERAAAREAAAQEYADYASAHAALTTRARAARDTANRGASTARRKFAAGRVDKVTRDRMVDGATGGAQAARRIEAQAERLPAPEQPRRQWQLRLQFPALPDAPRVLASLDGVVVRAGSFTLGPVSATLHSRDRVLLSGANGAGKTLLLAILRGTQVADGGRVTALEGRLTAVLDQGRALPDSPTALAAARILLPLLTAEEVRTHLAKFGLDADDLGRSPSLLSWGERTRLQLAVAASGPTAALVLDEPTNHIDLPAIEQLEQALAAYPGAVVLVSHDARLRSTFRATSHWRLDAGQMVTETKED